MDMTPIEKIIHAYAIAKICNPDLTMQQVEELYSKYVIEGHDEYNKLHSQDSLASCEAIKSPF